MPQPRRAAGLCVLALATALIAAGCAAPPAARPSAAAEEIDARIRFYTRKIEKSPRLYPVYVQLANAYLEKARATSDPFWLAEARLAVARSTAIGGTYEAFVTSARIACYAHRFEDAIRWARRAQGANPLEPDVAAILVEAYAALGADAEARALLPPEGSAPTDFRTAAALAGCLGSEGRYPDAARAYDAAAGLARTRGAREATLWAEVMAAGALLDGGRPDLARPRLDAARRRDPGDLLLRLHDAECLEAERRPREALAVYERLLDERPADPEIHARAWALSRALGEDGLARRHFEAAERAFRRPLAAREVYTLGALARLYCDAGVRLDEALSLAEENLLYRHDREARTLIADVRMKLRPRPGVVAVSEVVRGQPHAHEGPFDCPEP